MKEIFEAWRLTEAQERFWYHGTKEGLKGELRPLWLAPSKSVSSMHGNKTYTFRIKPEATWKTIEDPHGQKSGVFTYATMDSIGYLPQEIERVRKQGADVVWDKPDYARGNQQIFIINPEVLELVKED